MRTIGLFTIAVLLCFSGFSYGENLKLDIDEVFVADSLVQMKLSVTNTANSGVGGLQASNFAVATDSDSIPEIRPAVMRSEDGIALVICLDTSGSMPLDNIKSALLSYIGTLRSQDRVALITFNDDVEEISAFTGSVPQLRTRIESLERAGSHTELYKGIFEGLVLLRDESPEGISRRYLLVMSDGKNEYTSSATYELDHCVDLAQDIAVPIMAIGYTDIASNETYLQSLENMASRTGGSYLRAMTAANLGSRLQETLRILNCQYQVEFEIPADLMDSEEHSYTVAVTSGISSGIAEFTATGEGEVAVVVVSKGLSLLWIIIIGVVLLLIILAVILLKRASKRKINILNEELLNSKDNIEKMRKSQKAAAEARAKEQIKAFEESSKPKPKQDKNRFRRTMVGEVTSNYTKGSLQVISGADKDQVFDVSRPVTTIGRSSDNAVVLESNVQGSSVSRSHAVLRFAVGQFQLEDQNSANGTMVNGRKITSSRLNNGDRVRFGKVELIFKGE